jgi:hypothetical protein
MYRREPLAWAGLKPVPTIHEKSSPFLKVRLSIPHTSVPVKEFPFLRRFLAGKISMQTREGKQISLFAAIY